MKKFLLMAAVATTLVNCSSDFDLSEGQGGGGVSDVIGFQVQGRNSIKRGTLQEAKHYNFGVFAYKSTDQTNNIMENYLVGYLKDGIGYSTSGSTTDDPNSNVDGKSNWMYEGMGWAQFQGTYAGENVAEGTKYASNNQYQYLRYWDKSAPSTCFYAYVPYLNAAANGNKTVTYVDGTAKGTDVDASGNALNTDTYVMTFPNGTIQHGYDDVQAYEYMYASTKVDDVNYGHDVSLKFIRLNAKVNIKFWEDIPGYSVHMIDLGTVSGTNYTISAVPSINDGRTGTYGYRSGKIYTENGVKIQFDDGAMQSMKQYKGTTSSAPLAFATPTAAQIGENRVDATPSTTTYFAIPKWRKFPVLKNDAKNINDEESSPAYDPDLVETGLTFHVSYELISTTGEKITVKDATVHVGKEYCEWKENKAYTYIFKITTNSNGTTGSEDPKPTDPSVPTETALYPIVFDNCTVVDWKNNESEWEITDAVNTWYDVKLDNYSFNNTSETKVTVTVDRSSKNPLDNSVTTLYPAKTDLSVTGPDGTTAIITEGQVQSGYESWSINNNEITVPAGAATGKYTITYTASDHDVNANNPVTYTENFFVGSDCDVKTNLGTVATGADADTYLQILTKTNGADFVNATSGSNLFINYPINVTSEEKVLVTVTTDGKVKVAKTAKPGKYELVYKLSGIDAPVVKNTFEVKDYGLSLNTNTVELGATAVDVEASTTYTGSDYTIKCDKTTGVSQNDKTFSIDNAAAEGVYTITLTVDASDATSKAIYTKTFTVENTYDLQLSKTTISRGNNVANEAEWSVDEITLSTYKNGVADNERSTSLTVWNGSTNVSTQFDIQANASGNSYVLKVKRATATGNYTIKFEGQSGKIVEKTITVQD